ncbi:hypothetical protein D9M68_853140 [compost metagenome]
MADRSTSVIPFPKRPSPLNDPELSSDSLQAAAEMRAAMLGELLRELVGPDGLHPENLRLKFSTYAAQELLDEMVLLYRRALSQSHGGSADE